MRRNKKFARRFLLLGLLLVAVLLSSCAGKSAERPAGYTDPDLVVTGVCDVGNKIISSGRVVRDEDARAIARLCIGGGIEGKLTEAIFKVSDIVGDNISVELQPYRSAEWIDENNAIGCIVVRCTIHTENFGDKTIDSAMDLEIERLVKDKTFPWSDGTPTNFWYVKGVDI